MFQLSVLKDNICIAPKYLNKPLASIVKRELTHKYANRIVHGLGLAITVHDIIYIGDPIVHPGDGSPFVRVTFELVVFRPFEFEILEGKIRSSTDAGIHLSLGFFDDVFLPAACMQPDSHFDPKEQLWYWNRSDGARYMELNQNIRFRAYADQFIDHPPVPKDVQLSISKTESSTSIHKSSMPYYVVYASIAEDGLGLISWWDTN